MRRINKKTKVAIASSALLLLSVSGTAYAYWTTTGAGTATATTGTNIALTVAQDGTVTNMVPGGAAQAVNYTITNSASTPQYATSVTIGIANVTYTNAAGTGLLNTALDHPAGMVAVSCVASDFTIVQPDALGVDLPAGATAFTRGTSKKSGTIAMDNEAYNQDDCKNTTVNLTFTVA